jgi:hypothetical protein
LSGLFFERRSTSTGFSDTPFGNVDEVIDEFLFAFANGISTETGDVSDECDPIVSDGEGEETGDVALITFVKTLKQ